MTPNLNQKTVLITGGATGIGAAFAREAHESGARVLIAGRHKATLDTTAAEIDPTGGIVVLPVDLTDRAALQTLLTRLDRDGTKVDVLVNNAGAGASGPLVQDNPAKIRAMLELNVIALTYLTHWAANHMAKRGGGQIINLSAAVASRPVPHFAAYSASKAYVTNLSIALTQELRSNRVTVTAVHPPAVATSFSAAGKADIGSTLVLKLFGPLGPSPLTVARKAYLAARRGSASVNVGWLAGAIYRSGFILPNALDLPIMAMLFRHRAKKMANVSIEAAPSNHCKAV
jgi:short-subunit dehydrogenase